MIGMSVSSQNTFLSSIKLAVLKTAPLWVIVTPPRKFVFALHMYIQY